MNYFYGNDSLLLSVHIFFFCKEENLYFSKSGGIYIVKAAEKCLW